MSSDKEQDHDDVDDDVDDDLVLQAPSLYTRPTYFRQTRKRGKIFKTVNERYLRDDLGFGCYFPQTTNVDNAKNNQQQQPRVIETTHELFSLILNSNTKTSSSQYHQLVVCDTNVLLHNMDVLEQATLQCNTTSSNISIVIPQTALMECRKNRRVAYDRTVDLLRSRNNNNNQGGGGVCILLADPHHAETAHVDLHTLGEGRRLSANDENDARIRNVALFYARHMHSIHQQVQVLLLTDDQASRQRAAEDAASSNYKAMSVRAWVQELERHHPELALSDLVAQFGTTTTGASASHTNDNAREASSSTTTKQYYFEPHLDATKLSHGIQSGLYHRGVFRSALFGGLSSSTGVVTIRRGQERVAVTLPTAADCNRAVNGDVVAIALHPLDQWITSTTTTASSPVGENGPGGGVNDDTGIASETAAPSLGEMENVQESVSLLATTGTTEASSTSSSKTLRPTAKVVGIIRRNFVNLSGSIYSKHKTTPATTKNSSGSSCERDLLAAAHEREHAYDGSSTCLFFPVDKKMQPVLLRTTQRDRLLGQRIVVSVDSWPATSAFPLGHYVRTIGPAGTKDVETEVLLQEHEIPHEPFSAAVLACLPPSDYRIDAENSPGRQDLRHLPVLSIDPPGCKDIDDALHCMALPNGNYQVGVHIADVAHYVKAGTAIDLEAASRSTSTYLVNKRLDMLPGLLTTDLCSLKANVDRYAFSVLWEVTPDAEIVNVEFQKTIIHSIAALTYQQAQSLIDQPDNNDPSDIQACAVKRLALLARQFRKRRIQAGALTLASPEVKFVLDSESLNPTDVQAYALLEANAVVEEFMLLANVTVAKKILRHFPTLSVLRRHPAPNRAMFDGLIEKAKCRGFELDIEDSKRLADSLDAATDESDPYINKLLRILSTRCMSPAQYFCSGEYRPMEWQHYGLAAPVYTHFTSPIRRYADVCVHRLLAAAIGVAPLPVHLSSKSYLHDVCANMNRRHRAAQLAGRASVQLHTLLFFAGDNDEDNDSNNNINSNAKEEDAYVLDVETAESSEPSFRVMVPRYGIEGRVKLSVAADDPNLERLPKEHRLVYRRPEESAEKTTTTTTTTTTVQQVQVFDKVRVRIWVREFEDHQRELVLDLLSPCFGSSSSSSSSQQDLVANKRSTSSEETATRRAKKAKV